MLIQKPISMLIYCNCILIYSSPRIILENIDYDLPNIFHDRNKSYIRYIYTNFYIILFIIMTYVISLYAQ